MRFLHLSVIAILFRLLPALLCSPLPLGIKDPQLLKGSKADVDRITSAVHDAHARVLKMKAVLQNPNNKEHQELIRNAFGKHAKVKEILKTVEKMENYHMNILHVHGQSEDRHKIAGTLVPSKKA
ncbi:hypothetical protein NLJ89_g10460 [Agrocybe chaxingu]|uniref:Uncharacterized protein n=1 Tax=Agrocybe chaxingu TaxID=84603 RepID=A0A9W8JNU7_9AGAR|nr:hypothetical protein NLJ89_g10460 [Agrocybe chaxingu]